MIILRSRAALPLALLAGAAPLEPLAAQNPIHVQATAITSRVHERAEIPGDQAETGGTWVGAALTAARGPLRIEFQGLRGQMSGTSSDIVERDGGEVRLNGLWRASRWFEVGAGYTARSFSSTEGYQHWSIVSLNAALQTVLGDSLIHGVVRASFSPIVSATLPQDPSMGLGTEIGVVAALAHAPFSFEASYRFERYSFTNDARVEELDWVNLAVHWKI